MNRLAHERSPYLLQHAANPVDWYPWGDEALERARRDDKPIFLSIGYSTCHWCHVMEHESFEDPAIAALLNRDFVAIKVDREERPDIDRVYMSFVQATTGSGGWPMSVFLTPDLKPFFGGTYFPPHSRWGRPGFSDLLGELARVWKDERAKVNGAASELFDRLRMVTGTGERSAAEGKLAGPEALDAGVEQFQRAYDARRGGFGDAPKFPRPSEMLFLLREHERRAASGVAPEAPLQMVTGTLRAMALGGMRDHVGGGFHRYSVDGHWRVPHFEKMLYDQAQLVLAYLEAAQATGDDFYATVAEDTLQYVLRDMTDAAGGFFSAEDADSVPPEEAGINGAAKTEGAFYLWQYDEIERLLGAEAELFRLRYGVERDGNAPHDPHGEFRGKNLLYIARSIEEAAREAGVSAEAAAESLARARQVLDEARKRRPRPHLDDKVLAGWNGLMIAAFARGARVLRARRHLERARRAAAFVLGRMWDGERDALFRRYRDGEAAIDAYAEDYAFLVWGLLELFQADADPQWLRWALRLRERQDSLFWDEAAGGWFNTTGTDRSVLLRLKEDYDGAEPSAGSVSLLNLLVLAHLTGDPSMNERLERALRAVGGRLSQQPHAVPMGLAALSAYHAGLRQVVLVGDRNDPGYGEMLESIASVYMPFGVVVRVEPGVQQSELSRMLPFVGEMRRIDGQATAYVCRDFVCHEPTFDPTALVVQLRKPAERR
jgi:uncharacterized protein